MISLSILTGAASLFGAKKAPMVTNVEPPYWWTDMQEPSLQVMVTGPGIADARVSVAPYPGVELTDTVSLDSPNYKFLYFNISPEAAPGKLDITFNLKGRKYTLPYELRQRDRKGEDYAGFDASDVLYLLMPDRFAQGDFDALRKACTKYPDLWSDMLLLDKLREHNLTPAALIEMVIEHYTPRLQAIFPDDWPRRQQGLSELAHIASAYTDLEQFVADLSLETPEDDADEFDEAGRVVLSTIHSSKGLEWDAVILLDLVEDRFPSRHALVRPEDFEEERRLMYVACTRAREDLELFVPATPSPFVRELPFSALEEWQEGYTGRISKRSTSFAGDPAFSRPSLDIPRELANPNAGRVKGVFPPPVIPEAKGDRAASKGGAGCGYCRHKVFGRGKIVEQLPPDKCRVNFPGFGLKVILSAFLTLEE
mgnify:CR=1 FL=1